MTTEDSSRPPAAITNAPTGAAVRYSDLHAARGWAALAVAVFHLSLLWPESQEGLYGILRNTVRYGWAGVDLFFVLSGFVLAAPFFRTGEKPSYWRFVLRRWVRVAPPFYFSILLALILLDAWQSAFANPRYLPQLLLFLQNATPDTLFLVNPIYWTLAIEFQFYLLFPALLAAFRSRWWALAAVGSVAASLVFRFLFFSNADGSWNAWAGFQIVPFLGHFGLGMAAARLLAKGVSLPRPAMLSWLAFAALAVVPLLLMIPPGNVEQDVFARWKYVVARPLLAAGFAAFVFLRAARGSTQGSRIHAWLGNISYSLYLVHAPVMVFIAGRLEGVDILALSPLLLTATLAVAAAFWILFERPALVASQRVRVRASPSVQAPRGVPTP